MRSESYCTWSVSVSVCLSVTTFSATKRNKTTNDTIMFSSSVLHWLDFKFGEFRKSTAFQSYGMKTK